MNNNKHQRYLSVFFICVSSLLVLLTTLVASYSVLTADDFSHGISVGVSNVDFITYLKASWAFMINIYKTWQGTYFSMFIQGLLSPANNLGLTQLSIVMVVNSVLLFGSIALCIFKGLRFKENDLFIKSIFFFIVVVEMTCFVSYEEIYTWFSGATSYSFPLSFCLIGITCLLQYFKNKKSLYVILACLCGFISGGGSLTIGGFGCYTVLVLVVYDYLNNKKLDKQNIVVLCVWIISALINVLAPGNYIRHGATDSTGLHLITGLTGSIIMVLMRCRDEALYSAIVLFLLISFMVGYYFGDKENSKNKFICALLYALVSFVVSFPVALATSGPNLSNRICFIVDFSIVVSSIPLAYNIGSLIKENNYMKYLVYVSMALFVLSIFTIKPTNIINVINNLSDGNYITYHKEYEEILNKLENSKGLDVIISNEEYPNDIDGFANLSIDSDSTYWTNVAIAKFYNLRSISKE